jgi:chemotaxis protein histidine kinase CheA
MGTLDSFLLEAGEYLERLDALAQTPAGPFAGGEEFVRFARAFRGSALMATQHGMARAAQGLESVARAVRESGLEWDERVRAEVTRAVDDCKVLMRRLREPDPGDQERAEAIGSNLDRLSGSSSAERRVASTGARDVVDAGRPAAESEEAGAFAAKLLAAFTGDVVPIEALFYADAGPHVVSRGAAPAPVAPATAAAPPVAAALKPITAAPVPAPAASPEKGADLATAYATFDRLVAERSLQPGSLDEPVAGGAGVAAAAPVDVAVPVRRPVAPTRELRSVPAEVALREDAVVPIEALAPAEEAVVPIESLLYGGDRALKRILELKPDLDASAGGDGARLTALLNEVFDLVELGLGAGR